MLEILSQPFNAFLSPDLAALALAMIWGQKKGLPPDLYQQFQVTGLLHLLVLSGQNITLLLGCLEAFIKHKGLKWRLILTISIAMFYLCTFPTEAPIIRASIMAILSSLAWWESATTPSLIILGFTCLIMLGWHPEWLGSLSFQLSVAATFGILVFYPRLSARFKGFHPLRQSFLLSLSAQLGTFPLLLLNFREYSLLSLPINVLVAWLIEPIMLVGVIFSVLGAFLPLAAQIIALPLSLLLFILKTIVALLAPISQLFILRL